MHQISQHLSLFPITSPKLEQFGLLQYAGYASTDEPKLKRAKEAHMSKKIKSGDRVTTLGNRHLPNGWGTVVKVIDTAKPHMSPPKSQRYLAEVLWDGREKSSIIMLTYLFKDGESPVSLNHSKETLADPKRRS